MQNCKYPRHLSIHWETSGVTTRRIKFAWLSIKEYSLKFFPASTMINQSVKAGKTSRIAAINVRDCWAWAPGEEINSILAGIQNLPSCKAADLLDQVDQSTMFLRLRLAWPYRNAWVSRSTKHTRLNSSVARLTANCCDKRLRLAFVLKITIR